MMFTGLLQRSRNGGAYTVHVVALQRLTDLLCMGPQAPRLSQETTPALQHLFEIGHRSVSCLRSAFLISAAWIA